MVRQAWDTKGQRTGSGEQILERPGADENQSNGVVKGTVGVSEGMVRNGGRAVRRPVCEFDKR
eukprot:7230625-Heterocapsa_arctica.AAC.1